MKHIIAAMLALCSIRVHGQQQHPLNAAIDSLRNEKDTTVLNQRLQKLGGGSERDLSVLVNYYTYNKSARDSAEQLAVQRFPKGDIAFSVDKRNLNNESDPVKREKYFHVLSAKYPDRDPDQLKYAVAQAYSQTGNLAKTKAWLESMKESPSSGNYRVALTQEMMNIAPASAAALLKPLIEKMISTGPPEPPAARSQHYYILALYGAILVKEGKYQQAYKYVTKAYENLSRKDVELNTSYALVLSKNGQYAEALPVLQQLVDKREANPLVKEAFVTSYEKAYPGKSAKAYLAELDQQLKEKLEDEVAALLINEPSPYFTVKDASGKTVTLADFKGKTIILDFWATWCGPCKKSFPSMQRVVNSYRKDHDVKFLFIHTRETVADPLTDAKNYLAGNKYDFDLYMDMKDVTTNKNPAVTAFGAKGIPAKYIIDKNGNIRFKVIGFSGSDDVHVAEISAMIEIVKKSNS